MVERGAEGGVGVWVASRLRFGLGLGVCEVQHLGHTEPDGNARPPTPLTKSLMESLWALYP